MRLRFGSKKGLVVAFLSVLAANGVVAASFDDPEWPCIQRKVPELSIGQMWAGPQVDDAVLDLAKTNEVRQIASRIAYRRTTIEEAEALISDYAESLTEDRNAKLTAVFAAAFDQITDRRSTVMAGIARYAQRQTGISQEIEQMRSELRELEAADEPNYDRMEELQDNLTWETRIFQDRQQSLTYVCETPVILEQRAFALARAIQGHLVD